jgi:hypothetical protein
MEKPPVKKKRGPYGKRNYDSNLKPFPLTLDIEGNSSSPSEFSSKCSPKRNSANSTTGTQEVN